MPNTIHVGISTLYQLQSMTSVILNTISKICVKRYININIFYSYLNVTEFVYAITAFLSAADNDEIVPGVTYLRTDLICASA